MHTASKTIWEKDLAISFEEHNRDKSCIIIQMSRDHLKYSMDTTGTLAGF